MLRFVVPFLHWLCDICNYQLNVPKQLNLPGYFLLRRTGVFDINTGLVKYIPDHKRQILFFYTQKISKPGELLNEQRKSNFILY